jgi:hypothetical protein
MFSHTVSDCATLMSKIELALMAARVEKQLVTTTAAPCRISPPQPRQDHSSCD